MRGFKYEDRSRYYYLGYVDLLHWKSVHLALKFALGTIHAKQYVSLDIFPVLSTSKCLRQWEVTSVAVSHEETKHKLRGGHDRNEVIVNFSLKSMNLEPYSQKPYEVHFKNYSNPLRLKSQRTLSVLRPPYWFLSVNYCMCCRERKATYFCFNDNFGRERKMCWHCRRHLVKMPIELERQYHVSKQDMEKLIQKAGRVFVDRKTYNNHWFWEEMIRVVDVEIYFQQSWLEFTYSTARRRSQNWLAAREAARKESQAVTSSSVTT